MDVPAGVTQEEGNTGFSIHLLSAVLALMKNLFQRTRQISFLEKYPSSKNIVYTGRPGGSIGNLETF